MNWQMVTHKNAWAGEWTLTSIPPLYPVANWVSKKSIHFFWMPYLLDHQLVGLYTCIITFFLFTTWICFFIIAQIYSCLYCSRLNKTKERFCSIRMAVFLHDSHLSLLQKPLPLTGCLTHIYASFSWCIFGISEIYSISWSFWATSWI